MDETYSTSVYFCEYPGTVPQIEAIKSSDVFVRETRKPSQTHTRN
jgi:hypothetical protein